MDTSNKSVLVPIKVYKGIKKIAELENRSISVSSASCLTCFAEQKGMR